MSDQSEWGLETVALHAGYSPMPVDMKRFNSFVPPIVQSVIYPFENVAQGSRVIAHEEYGYGYGRTRNPTVDVLQQRLAALEGGQRAMVTASGMLAVFTLTFHLAKVGDEIVASHLTYGEANKLFFQLAHPRMGISPGFVANPADLDDWERQITPRTKFVWAETPSNPGLFVTDIAGLAEVAHSHNVPLIVDNTLATPWLQQPLALGADIVILSLTKALCGNGTVVGGAVVGQEELIADMLKSTLPYMGATMSPFDAWLALLSLETLPIRMDRHSAIAEQVVNYLAQHPRVTRVYYPSHGDPAQQELAKRQMPRGFGGVLSFVVDGDRAAAAKVMDSFKLIALGPTFGTTRSVANHPASFTHHTMKPEEREAAGVPDGLIRLSVGLERPEDIIADLERALDQQ